MANSIFNSFNPNNNAAAQSNDPKSIVSRIMNFKQQCGDNPKATVMNMLQQGKVSESRVQAAYQQAQQLMHLFK